MGGINTGLILTRCLLKWVKPVGGQPRQLPHRYSNLNSIFLPRFQNSKGMKLPSIYLTKSPKNYANQCQSHFLCHYHCFQFLKFSSFIKYNDSIKTLIQILVGHTDSLLHLTQKLCDSGNFYCWNLKIYSVVFFY